MQFGIFDWVEAPSESSARSPGEVYEHKLELATAAERAEAERQAQQPAMDPAEYYAEWLLVRVERDEIP